jgi:cytochrome d ubiquinol oxidase subunit II
MTAGATMLGRINPEADSFYAAYLAPWLNPFSFLVGLFFASICSFLAAVFLVGETEDLRLKELFFRQTIASNVVAVLSGLGVFISGQLMGINLLQLFLGEPFALGMVIISTLLVPFLWRNLGKGRKWLSRLFAGGIVGFILAAWLAVQFPDMVKLSDGAITIATSQAPPQVITAMGWALIAGSLLIFPSLYYLYRVFKLQ